VNKQSGQLTLPLFLDEDKQQAHGNSNGGQAYRVENRVFRLRERLQQNGVLGLSNIELITIALCSGPTNENAIKRIYQLVEDHSLTELISAEFGRLRLEYGLTVNKAMQFQAILELARRLTMPSLRERFQIITPLHAANLVMAEMSFLDHEEMRVLVLDTKNFVVANLRLYQGTVNSTVTRASEIFRPAILRNCPGIVVAHNHPSGSPEPSSEDLEITKQLVEAGNLLNIDLVDHIIIGQGSRFVSLKERMRWE